MKHIQVYGINCMKQKRIILIGYKIGSRSLKNLQANLKEDQQDRRVLRVRKDSVRYKRRPSDKIVTWGKVAPSPHELAGQEQAKHIACNKLLSFRKFKEHGVSCPEWTDDNTTALEWLDAGILIAARTKLTGHSGDGIYLCQRGGEEPIRDGLVHARLYVQYKKKKHEFRVHVFQSKVIDVTQKKRRAGFEGRNNQIRNHQNGWVYCRENIQEPEGLQQLALAACSAIGLLSGAVDIIWNEKENKCYVLEINTAPGVEGTTCKKYTNEIIASL